MTIYVLIRVIFGCCMTFTNIQGLFQTFPFESFSEVVFYFLEGLPLSVFLFPYQNNPTWYSRVSAYALVFTIPSKPNGGLWTSSQKPVLDYLFVLHTDIVQIPFCPLYLIAGHWRKILFIFPNEKCFH